MLASGGQVWTGFFQSWPAEGLGWFARDPARCTYGIFVDATLSLGDGGWAGSAVEVDYVVGCVVGVGGDRSLIILPLSLQSRLPRSDRISNLPEMG